VYLGADLSSPSLLTACVRFEADKFIKRPINCLYNNEPSNTHQQSHLIGGLGSIVRESGWPLGNPVSSSRESVRISFEKSLYQTIVLRSFEIPKKSLELEQIL